MNYFIKSFYKLFTVLLIVLTLTSCSLFGGPKTSLNKAFENAANIENFSSRTEIDMELKASSEFKSLLKKLGQKSFDIEDFKKISMNLKGDWKNKVIEGSFSSPDFESFISFYINEKLLAITLPMMKEKTGKEFILMTNDDIIKYIAQLNNETPTYFNVFSNIFQSDEFKTKAFKEGELKALKLMIDSIDSKYVQSDKVSFQGNLVSGEFQEIAIDINIENILDTFFKFCENSIHDDKIMHYLLTSINKSTPIHMRLDKKGLQDAFKMVTAGYAKAKKQVLAQYDYLSLQDSKIIFGLDASNNMRYIKLHIKFNIDMNTLAKAKSDNLGSVSGYFSITTELDQINQTSVQVRTFDDANSVPYKEIKDSI